MQGKPQRSVCISEGCEAVRTAAWTRIRGHAAVAAAVTVTKRNLQQGASLLENLHLMSSHQDIHHCPVPLRVNTSVHGRLGDVKMPINVRTYGLAACGCIRGSRDDGAPWRNHLKRKKDTVSGGFVRMTAGKS